MDILGFLRAIDGQGQLFAQDGQFLGLLSSNPNNPNSIINPNTFGNSLNPLSIQNQTGVYGSSFGLYSPYNISCISPPIIYYKNQPVLMVTKNHYAINNGLSVVDPDQMLNVYQEPAVASPDVIAKKLTPLKATDLLERDKISVDFVRSANNKTHLLGYDGQFLGFISSDHTHGESLLNPYGFGDPSNPRSIRNKTGLYGGHGRYSPYTPDGDTPPLIFYNGQPIVILTNNPMALIATGLPIITPDALVWLLLSLEPQLNSNLIQQIIQLQTWG